LLTKVREKPSPRGNAHAARQLGDLSGRQVLQLDPMLASGGTLKAAMRLVVGCGTDGVPVFCLLAAPEGQRRCSATSVTRRL
jgi:uracil phosphoribosyltransferase